MSKNYLEWYGAGWIGEGLSYLTKLINLEVDLEEVDIIGVGGDFIADSIINLINLAKLKLKFFNNSIDEVSGIKLS